MRVKVTFATPIVESDPPEMELGPFTQGVAIEGGTDLASTQILRDVATRDIIARQTRIGDWKIESNERPHRIYSMFFVQCVPMATGGFVRTPPLTI